MSIIDNEENTKKLVQIQMQYDFDKKTVADSVQNAALAKVEILKHNQEIHQQKIYVLGGAIGFLLMLIVAAVSFRAFKQKQKANTELANKNEQIELQKSLVEEKNKDIMDSIRYAKRIQKSLLPTEKYIQKSIVRLKRNERKCK